MSDVLRLEHQDQVTADLEALIQGLPASKADLKAHPSFRRLGPVWRTVAEAERRRLRALADAHEIANLAVQNVAPQFLVFTDEADPDRLRLQAAAHGVRGGLWRMGHPDRTIKTPQRHEEAYEEFSMAISSLSHGGARSAEDYVLIYCKIALLERDRRNLDVALWNARKARDMAKQDILRGLAETTLASALFHIDPREAAKIYRSARETYCLLGDRSNWLYCTHNMAWCMLEFSEPFFIRRVISEIHDGADSPVWKLHATWLEGRTLELEGRTSEAEDQLGAAFVGFSDLGMPHYSIVAGLELSRAQLRGGATQAAEKTAILLGAIAGLESLPEEFASAVLSAKEAAEARSLTDGLLSECALRVSRLGQ